MAEQLANRDVVAVWNQAGEPVLDAVVERELPLADQLEDDGSDERLRDAPDPETIADPQRRPLLEVGIAARELHGATVTTDEHDDPRNSFGDKSLDVLSQRRGEAVSRSRGGGRAGCEQKRQDDARSEAAHDQMDQS